MADRKVRDYIRDNLMNGHGLKRIVHYLAAHGHSREDIEEAISELSRDLEQGAKAR